MKHADTIIQEAIDQYHPIHVLLLFSGGHDSLVSTHFSASYLKLKDIPFTVYHGDTTIGIPETQDYVRDVCNAYGWDLAIRRPPSEEDWYKSIVAKYGFPGPGKKSHQFMYRRLKERALRAYVTHEVKSKPRARENVLLITGIRKDESRIRMGYINPTSKEDSRVWCNPIFYWSKQTCEAYMKGNNLPRNPVKDSICISGECLCGAFASMEERAEIRQAYPHVDAELRRLESIAKENGYPWPWSQGPAEWYNNHPPGMQDMFTGEVNPAPSYMCVGCKSRQSAGR